ncbi:MAG: imidazole glycerol phosphate synthase subunit HisH [Candidatus Geothermincolia bacterium]
MIVVIDYGMGNLGSITNMFRKIGAEVTVSTRTDEIERAEKIVLPGVGSFDHGMESLERLGLVPILHEKVLMRGTPVLGICLGMQLMTRSSEEGARSGMGWVAARTKKFRFTAEREERVPHMGWNDVRYTKESKLLQGISGEARYYFVHSYHVVCEDPSDVLATCDYGYPFTAAFEHGHIVGVQFHPEKSHKYGLQLLTSFVNGTQG